MGRRPKYSRASIEAAARNLIAERGVQAATIGAIAAELGAPTGSIYHRYRTRELLLAELWLGVVEEFQTGLLAELNRDDPLEAAVAAAQFVPRWVRSHLAEARLLLVHHRRDFVSGGWPEEVVERAGQLEPQLTAALRRFCRRHFGNLRKASLQRARFALLDAQTVQAAGSPC
ncbi:MAG: TetR/AcrR family transcriptional regulator, partial [Deltaproteobacteria bacterium]|nr:TetR/AcrR family transcriptional regulator [Deltaproteobacteria bacterium]